MNEKTLQSKRDPLLSHTPSSTVKPYELINHKAIKAIGDHSQSKPTHRTLISMVVSLYKSFPVLLPSSKYLQMWHILIILVIVYFLFEIGLVLGFGAQVWHDQLRYMYEISCTFIGLLVIDMIITPLKAIYLYGYLMVNRKVIAKEYAKVGFWLDLTSLVGVIIPYTQNDPRFNYLKLLFIFKLYSLYNIEVQVRTQFQTNTTRYLIYSIFRIVLMMTIISHYLAIGFYLVDLTIYNSNLFGPNTPNYCWLYNAMAYSQMILDLYWVQQYIYAIYFSMATMTTIAYGDITPLNAYEAAYIIVALLIYCLSIGYFVYKILQILLYAQSTRYQYIQTVSTASKIVDQNLISAKVSKEFFMQIEQSYLQERFRNKDLESTFFKALPNNVRFELLNSAHRYFIREIINLAGNRETQILKGFGVNRYSKFMLLTLQAIVEERLFRGEFLFQENQEFYVHEENHSVYYCEGNGAHVSLGVGKKPLFFIDKSDEFVESYNPQLYENLMKFADKHSLIGYEEFVTGSKRIHWAVLNKSSKFYKIGHNVMKNLILTADRYERQKLFEVWQQIMWKMRKCDICDEGGHNFQNCPTVTYQIQFEFLIKKFQHQNASRVNSHYLKAIRHESILKSRKFNAYVMAKQLKNMKSELQKIATIHQKKHHKTWNLFEKECPFDSENEQESSSSESSEQSDKDMTYLKEVQSFIDLQDVIAVEEEHDELAWEHGLVFQTRYDCITYKTYGNFKNVVEKYNNKQTLSEREDPNLDDLSLKPYFL